MDSFITSDFVQTIGYFIFNIQNIGLRNQEDRIRNLGGFVQLPLPPKIYTRLETEAAEKLDIPPALLSVLYRTLLLDIVDETLSKDDNLIEALREHAIRVRFARSDEVSSRIKDEERQLGQYKNQVENVNNHNDRVRREAEIGLNTKTKNQSKKEKQNLLVVHDKTCKFIRSLNKALLKVGKELHLLSESDHRIVKYMMAKHMLEDKNTHYEIWEYMLTNMTLDEKAEFFKTVVELIE